jgi:SAM-dependent methyltransferase
MPLGRREYKISRRTPMQPNIRVNLEKIIESGRPLILEIGCGQRKKEGAITIDKLDLPHVDIVANLEEGLGFLPDSSVDEIHCRSVLEHIDNFENLMKEIVRVLKPNGKAYVFVPHFSNPYYYSDYTHKRFFGLYSFCYFVAPECQLKRKVPVFYTPTRIKILSLKLVFTSPFFISKNLKKIFGYFVNSHRIFKEFYEQHLCYILPCYGIEIAFSPVK